ncbi:MAG: DUF924 family protein [Myxococcota bacterium]
MSLDDTLVYRGPAERDEALLARLPGALRAIVGRHNGCVWLDGALHVRGACDAPRWHSLRVAWEAPDGVVATTPALEPTDIPFARTTFGDELALRGRDVVRVRAETGALEPLGTSVGRFVAGLERDPLRFLDLDPDARAPAADGAALLAAWFEGSERDAARIAALVPRWFGGGADFDALLGEQFGGWLERAEAGDAALDAWCATPRGALAAVLVHDQLPRNLRRGDPRAFALDAAARRIAARAIERGFDLCLRAVEAAFLYLPFEHAEDRAEQARSVALFEALRQRAPRAAAAAFDTFEDYARRHRDVVERFGRFPHRNATLGRAPTAEEEAFLAAGGDAF